MKKLLAFVLLVASTITGWAAGEKEGMDIFLFLGQSNMAGYGDIYPEDRQDLDGVFTLRETKDEANPYRWEKSHQPYNVGLPSYRFSLAGPFVQAYHLTYPNATVGVVSKAWGGAAISQMNKGTKFYDEIIRQAKWAKKSGTLKAILWHQGESDTVNKDVADKYEERLAKLINDLRTDLGMPDLPFIIGDLAEFYGTHKEHSAPERLKQIEQVREALRTMQDKLPNVGFVKTTGLVSHDFHQVHFGRDSYIILGNRYFDVYWTKFCKKFVYPEKK